MSQLTTDGVDNLQYVYDMLEQLEIVASGSGGPFLVYLIDLARHEASEKLQRSGASGKQGNMPA